MLERGEKIEIRLQDNDFGYSDGMAIFKVVDGKRYIARLTFEEYEPGAIVEPTIETTKEAGLFQELASAVRRLGILESADQATVKRLENHLEDMRKLVFQKPQPPYFVYNETLEGDS